MGFTCFTQNSKHLFPERTQSVFLDDIKAHFLCGMNQIFNLNYIIFKFQMLNIHVIRQHFVTLC